MVWPEIAPAVKKKRTRSFEEFTIITLRTVREACQPFSSSVLSRKSRELSRRKNSLELSSRNQSGNTEISPARQSQRRPLFFLSPGFSTRRRVSVLEKL